MAAEPIGGAPAGASVWWHPLATVRARTTLVAAVVVGLALFAGSFGMLTVLRNGLLKNIDEVAEVRAEDIAALARQDDLPDTLADPGEEDAGVQVVDRGHVVSSSKNLRGARPMATFIPPGHDPLIRNVRNAPRMHYNVVRVVAYNAKLRSTPVVIYVSTSLEPIAEILGIVRSILLVGTFPLFLLVIAVCWYVVGRALRPVMTMQTQAAEISGTRLDRRIAEPKINDEIGRLARTFNAMLERIEIATTKQRRFVGDASHELQSPLASARTNIEVALAHPDGADWMSTATELLESNDQMERLVQDLLYLARADEGTLARPHALVDLDDVVMDEVTRVAGDSGPDVDTASVSAAPVNGRREDLARLVRNLLDNARRHAASRVTVALRSENGDVVLTISDDGPGIPADARAHIFERFTRLDDARGPDGGGSGLGLAIAREIVTQHDGTIEAGGIAPHGARFTVRLPSV